MQNIKEAVETIRSITSFKPEIGIILGTGLGSLVDFVQIEKAIEYYRKASHLKYAPSLAVLGSCYYFGYGVEVSMSKALLYLKLPAVNGDMISQYLYGMVLTKGINKGEANYWFECAASAGHPDASGRRRHA